MTHDLLDNAGSPLSFAVRAAGPDDDVDRVFTAGTAVEVGDARTGAIGGAVWLDVVDLIEKEWSPAEWCTSTRVLVHHSAGLHCAKMQ